MIRLKSISLKKQCRLKNKEESQARVAELDASLRQRNRVKISAIKFLSKRGNINHVELDSEVRPKYQTINYMGTVCRLESCLWLWDFN